MADRSDERSGGMQGGRSQDWQQQGYSGEERRVGISYNYTGPERRTQQPERSRVPQGEYGQTGGMGMRPNTSDSGRFGTNENDRTSSSAGKAVRSGTPDRGGLVGSERPYEDEDDDL